MAQIDESKLNIYADAGVPLNDVAVTKVVIYAIVNSNTPPPPPPTPRRRATVWVSYYRK